MVLLRDLKGDVRLYYSKNMSVHVSTCTSLYLNVLTPNYGGCGANELWPSDWIFNHGNAPTRKVLSVNQFLAQKSVIETKHPPYSLDLPPNDFWLFPSIKFALK